jgi:hypothetical protein
LDAIWQIAFHDQKGSSGVMYIEKLLQAAAGSRKAAAAAQLRCQP